ncbi:hypothetical protein MUQ_08323 [Vibrio harveyi CAIM 1792]|nr:hypothetical protein MUQ_08323 [Vibrio harveyi CAIM 1792]
MDVFDNECIKDPLLSKINDLLYPSNLEMLGSARMTWFVDAATI